MTGCWVVEVAPGSHGACSDRLQRAHLVPQQLLKRELGGVTGVPCETCRAAAGELCVGKPGSVLRAPHQLRVREWNRILWDPRCWRWMCEAHHHALDHARTLRVPRLWVPPETEAFAAEHGLSWWLDREYGERLGVAA